MFLFYESWWSVKSGEKWRKIEKSAGNRERLRKVVKDGAKIEISKEFLSKWIIFPIKKKKE